MSNLAEGIAERARMDGEAKVKESERISSIRNLMKNMRLTVQQTMGALEIPADEQKRLRH